MEISNWEREIKIEREQKDMNPEIGHSLAELR